MPLKEKIEVYDRLLSDAAVAKETKGEDVKEAVSASIMPESTYYRWRKGTAEAIRAAINDVPSFGDLCEARVIDLTKYYPRDDDEEQTTPEEEEAVLSKLQQEEEAKNNAVLVLKALKDHVAPNSIVMDGTNGEGVFLSDPETKKLYSCILVDKYKNRLQNADKYKGILSFTCEGFQKYTTRKDVVMVFIWDPPYRTICGGHTVLNCVFIKSDSRMKFNSSYGVQFKYTNEMINAIYLRGFEWADQVLHLNGFFFVKCMQFNDGFDQLEAVRQMAELYNFYVKQTYTLKSVTPTREDSFLLVIKRKRSTVQSLRDVTFSTVEANECKQDMKRRINAKAAEAYVEAIKTSLKNGHIWYDACINLQAGLTEQQQCNAFKGIDEDIIDGFNSFQRKNEIIRQQMVSTTNWEALQSIAHSAQSIFLAIKNIAGLLFEQHLIQKGVRIEDPNSLKTKKDLETLLIGRNKKITLVNKKSHISLSENIKFLRDQEEAEEEEEEENNSERRVDEEEEVELQVEDDGEKKKQQKQTNITEFLQLN